MSNCGRYVLFPKFMDVQAGDYPRLIHDDVLKMPASDLFEWSIVRYGYDGRYGM
jgi:hypothetical protein